MNTDRQILFFLGLFVAGLTVLLEYLSRKGILPQWLSRKLLHIGAIGACALAPAVMEDLRLLTALVAVAEIALFYLVAKGVLFVEEQGRRSRGIALFPLAYLVLLLMFPEDRQLIVVPMALLAVSDAAAAISGHLLGKRFFVLTGDRKSGAGSLAFLSSAIVILWMAEQWGYGSGGQGPLFWTALIWIAILLTALEAMGSGGRDNLFVPLGAAFLLWRLPEVFQAGAVLIWWGALATAVGFSVWTIRKKSLTPDGAVAASLLGLWVVFFAGVLWLLPLLFFFLTGTILGRLASRRKVTSDGKHGRGRDAVQVWCNGGIFALLTPFIQDTFPAGGWLLLAVSIAVSTSDTWSSEIGIFFRGRTIDILRGQIVPVGLSGGVSGQGTLGGLAGALFMAILCSMVVFSRLESQFVVWVTLAGFAGMLLDSLLGAGLQARYRNPSSGRLSDQPGPGAALHSGFRRMTNDAINLLSNAVATGGAALLWILLQ